MLTRRMLSLFFLSFALFVLDISETAAQADDDAEPTTVSNVVDVTLPWGAQRVSTVKIPTEFNALFDKIQTESGGKIVGGAREVLAWQGNYKTRSKSDVVKNDLITSLRKEGWQFETVGNQDGIELFTLAKNGPTPRAIMGFLVANDHVFICALMEAQKPGSVAKQNTNNIEDNKIGASIGSSIVGKWFRSTGGSSIDWTGKTTLKGGDDFTFQFFADGTVEYSHKKEILNVMQCKINSQEEARGRYTLKGGTLTIDLDAMRSVGSNSCSPKENYDRLLGNSSMMVKVQINQADDITRPDRPYRMCFDGIEVCYEKQP